MAVDVMTIREGCEAVVDPSGWGSFDLQICARPVSSLAEDKHC